MFKLTIVAGHGRGTSFAIRLDGEVHMGRQQGNDIVLSSGSVSKRHCSVRVKKNEVILRDEGSANGTFVNGVLVKERVLRPGDRVSVGEYTLELRHVLHGGIESAPPAMKFANGRVIPFPKPQDRAFQETPHVAYVPDDLVGKAKWHLEKYAMPFFYSLYLRYDWKVLSGTILAIFAASAVALSTWPLVQENRKHVLSETIRRAQFMARTLVDRNALALSEGMETRTDLGRIPKEDGVRVAALVDLNGRIIAPHAKMNQQFAGGEEAQYLARRLADYRNGYERASLAHLGDNVVVSVEPVKIFVPQSARNMVVALAIVSIDASLTIPGLGEVGVAFSESLAIAAILGILCGFILLRLSMKPLEVLNEDVDKALKGELRTVTRELKHEELEPLFDVVDAALQRIDLGGEKRPDEESVLRTAAEDAVSAVRAVAETSRDAIVVLDSEKRVIYANSVFEEISGIRTDAAMGQELNAVARDQAFGALAIEIVDRARNGTATDDFDFSGVSYKVRCDPIGSGLVKGFVLALSRVAEEAA